MSARQQIVYQIKVTLQKAPFELKIKKVKKIKGGGSSENYICFCSQNKYFIKIFQKDGRQRAERLQEILALTSNQSQALKQTIFEMEENIGLVQNYISGKELKAFQLNPKNIDLISANYKEFLKNSKNLQALAGNEFKPEQCFQENINTINSLKIKYPQNKFFLQKIEQEQARIFAKIPAIKTQKQIIHGDLSVHNMLYNQKEDKMILIDFEDVRWGYPAEDIAKLVLSALFKYCVIFLPRRALKHIILAFNHNFCFTKEEWLYGVVNYFLISIKQRLRQEKFLTSWRKNLVYTHRLKMFSEICALLDELYETGFGRQLP